MSEPDDEAERSHVAEHLRAVGVLLARTILVAVATGLALIALSAFRGATDLSVAMPLVCLLGSGCLLVAWGRRDRAIWPWGCALAAGAPTGAALALPLLAGLTLDGGAWLQDMSTSAVASSVAALVSLGLGLALLPRRFSGKVTECPESLRGATVLVMTVAALVLSLDAGWINTSQPEVWRGQARTSSLLASRLPFSDALGWYLGTVNVANGSTVDFAARRPLHAVLRAGEFVVAGDSHQKSLIVQALFCALAITALTLVVWRTLTFPSACVLWAGLVCVAGAFVRSYLAGCSGFTVACLAAAYLLRGSHDGNVWNRLVGYGFLGLAWLIRPGPFGLLAVPAVLEWTVRAPKRIARGLLAVAVVGVVLLAGKATFRLVADPGAAENANAAITVYGLSMGMGWREAKGKFDTEDPSRLELSVSERATLQYSLAWAALRSDSGPARKLCSKNFKNGFGALVVGFPSELWLEWAVGSGLARNLVLLFVLPGGLYGLILLFRRTQTGSLLVGGAVVAGLASLPLIWGDGEWRGVLILLPFLLVFHSLGLSIPQLLSAPSATASSRYAEPLSLYVATAVTSLLLSIGLASFALSTPPKAGDRSVDVAKDPCVFLSDRRSPVLIGPPEITKREVVAAIQNTRLRRGGMDVAIAGVKTPALLYLQPLGNFATWMIVEGATPRATGRLVIEEFVPHEHRFFSRATRWHWLDPQ